MEYYCILDACTVLNLIIIDEDDILLKMLFRYKIFIPEKVLNEARDNKLTKFSTNEVEYFNEKISRFYPFMFQDKELKRNLGETFNQISKYCNYIKKENGELFSTALALWQSRQYKVFFHFYTDDFPAKEAFNKIFEYQQIGQIHDSVDLLTLLYWTNNNFSFSDYRRFLSSLFNEQFRELKELQNKIQNYKDSLSKNLRRNREFMRNLSSLLNAILNYQFDSINQYLTFFTNNKRKYRDVNKILNQYPKIFELSSSEEGNLASKLIRTLKSLERFEILKVA